MSSQWIPLSFLAKKVIRFGVKKTNMGICGSSKPKKSEVHVSLIRSDNQSNLMFAQTSELTIHDFLLRSDGALLIPSSSTGVETFLFAQNFASNPLTRECAILDFDLSGGPRLVNNSFRRDFQHAVWEVITFSQKVYQSKGTKLRQGDVIRLGDTCMILRLLSFDGAVDFSRTTNYTNFNSLGSAPEKPGNNAEFVPRAGVNCRVCLEEETESNPFVDVCSCFMTMPCHFKCLRDWFKKTVKPTKKRGLLTYEFQELVCDLCKRKLPSTAKVSGGDELPLVEPQLPLID